MFEITAPKRRRDKEGTKKKLLDAALEVFSLRGYENATTREIASKAGVSESLIQRYYDSKSGLLLALFTAYQNKMRENATQVAAEAVNRPDLRGGLQLAMMEYARREGEQRDFMRVMVPRAIVDEAVAKDVTGMVANDLVGPMSGMLAAWQKEGKVRADLNTEDLSMILFGLTFSLGFMNQTVLGFTDEKVMKLVAMAAQCLVEGISV